jgi:hypothetical protein
VRPPTPLLVATAIAGLQGLGLVALGVVGLLDLVSSRLEVGVSVAVFFVLYGVLLLGCALALWRLSSWARGPVLLTQLIQIGIAWNARDNAPLAAALLVVAVVAVVAMLRPATIRALLGEPEPDVEPGTER